MSPQAPDAVRVLVLSDLHLEFGTFLPPDPAGFDMAILAGDICPGVKAVQWAQRQSTFAGKPVVLVPGNHEFYGSERNRMLERMREHAADSNVHLIDRDEIVLNGVRFLGTTLWTDFKLDEERGTDVAQAMDDASRGLNDFRGSIREQGLDQSRAMNFAPADAAREHGISRDWLQDRLDATIDRSQVIATVVVTHHGPSSRSVNAIYEGSELNPCFCSELPASFFQTADLWVHGHTHSSFDYLHHRTRVVANPRGYLLRNGANENELFQRDLVITLGSG